MAKDQRRALDKNTRTISIPQGLVVFDESPTPAYVVVYDDYGGSYGTEMMLAGVFPNLEDAEAVADALEKADRYAKIIEVPMGKRVEEYIGGHTE